jgi:predicted permease
MRDSLIQAYLPLVIWVGLGAGLGRFLPATLPRWLGRGLYWVSIPLEIFALARQTHFAEDTGLAPLYTVVSLGLGLGLGLVGLAAVRSLTATIPVEAAAVGVAPGSELLSPDQTVGLSLWPDTATLTWADNPARAALC